MGFCYKNKLCISCLNTNHRMKNCRLKEDCNIKNCRLHLNPGPHKNCASGNRLTNSFVSESSYVHQSKVLVMLRTVPVESEDHEGKIQMHLLTKVRNTFIR